MELKDIKKLNQRIYELNTEINRNSKTIFVATLIFALTQNREFQNVGKLTELINFSDEEKRLIEQIIDLAKEGIENLSLLDKQMNSSAGSDEIREKLNKYKNARK